MSKSINGLNRRRFLDLIATGTTISPEQFEYAREAEVVSCRDKTEVSRIRHRVFGQA